MLVKFGVEVTIGHFTVVRSIVWLCLNLTARPKDNRGVLGASFRVEWFSEIVGYFNMADYTGHIICEFANGKTMLITRQVLFFLICHVKSCVESKAVNCSANAVYFFS